MNVKPIAIVVGSGLSFFFMPNLMIFIPYETNVKDYQ